MSVCTCLVQKPTFTVGHYVFHVAENQPSGSRVGRVSAVDRDEAPRDQFTYVMMTSLRGSGVMMTSSANGGFRVDGRSGLITTAKAFDRERRAVYQFTVGTNSSTGRGRLTPTQTKLSCTVTVRVNDVNDNRPLFSFPRPGLDTLTMTFAKPNVTWSQQQVRAFDLDRGLNGVVRYSVVAGNGSRLIQVYAVYTGWTKKASQLSRIVIKSFLKPPLRLDFSPILTIK